MQKIFTLFLFSILTLPSFAETVRLADSKCTSKEAPKVNYIEAIQIALKAANVNDDVKEVSISGAYFLCEGEKSFWAVGLNKLQNDKNKLLVKVFMDKTTEVSIVQDNQPRIP